MSTKKELLEENDFLRHKLEELRDELDEILEELGGETDDAVCAADEK